MNLFHNIFLTALIASSLHGVTPTKELNPKLLSIFEQFQAESEQSKLEGKEYEADLTVKVATEKFLIFSDAYLQADEENKYQIGKWDFTPDQVTELEAKRGDILSVRFKIEEIRTEPPYADMPHFTATILSIVPERNGVDPVDGGQ